MVLYFALSYLEEFQSPQQSKASTNSTSPSRSTNKSEPPWLNPPSGKLKLNTDAAVNKTTQITGCGVVLRNSNGDIVAASSKSIPGVFRPEIMEALALMNALKLLIDNQLTAHILETDSLLVVNGLHSSIASVYDFHCLLSDISHLVFNFPGVQISHVYRFANTAAHLLVKYAISVDSVCIWLEEIPPPLNAYCIMDD
uniref:RNase H type-1 domain-containing protein n=1 Tax=Cannabis sativa TaxID=3483 RepID=A0A803PD22_CANSA